MDTALRLMEKKGYDLFSNGYDIYKNFEWIDFMYFYRISGSHVSDYTAQKQTPMQVLLGGIEKIGEWSGKAGKSFRMDTAA